MSGMGGKVAGPGRQIYDRSYYMNLLKSKNNEIMNEINKLKSEVEEINKDN
jgi:intraflagellar transport protein 74